MSDYFESGFCVRRPSWHGKERLLAEAPGSWGEARELAGLMWEPVAETVYRKVNRNEACSENYPDATFNGRCWTREVERFEPVTSSKLIARDDTRAELGSVGSKFELITHADMGWIMEPVLEQAGCTLETMGSVKEGRQVYATVLLDEPYEVRGDIDGFGDQVTTLPYFAIINSHDGSGACKGLYTQVRLVCANTVQAGSMDGDRTGAQFHLRHTSGAKVRLEQARQVVDGCRAEAARWREMAEALALMPVTDAQQLQYLSEFIPMPPKGVVSDRVRANVDRDQGRFLHILRDSLTNCEMQHTALGLVNASVEFLDHLRGFRNTDTYVGRQLLNTEPLKARSIKLVRELVGAN